MIAVTINEVKQKYDPMKGLGIGKYSERIAKKKFLEDFDKLMLSKGISQYAPMHEKYKNKYMWGGYYNVGPIQDHVTYKYDIDDGTLSITTGNNVKILSVIRNSPIGAKYLWDEYSSMNDMLKPGIRQSYK